jgi:thiol-disulfide isomerase/thioredoxin
MGKIFITLLLLLTISFTALTFAQIKPVHSKQTHLENGMRTVIAGTVDVKNWTDSIEFYIYSPSDTNVYRSYDHGTLKTSVLDSGKFHFAFNITNPVYLVPKHGASGTLAPYAAFNEVNTRFISMGILIEPGDSIMVSNFRQGIVDQNGYTIGMRETANTYEATYRGRGAEKLWCIQTIIRNTNMFHIPWPKENKGNGPDVYGFTKFSDSVTSMILRTIDLYKYKLSAQAQTIIKAHYIPMLAFHAKEFIEYFKLDIQDPSVKKFIRATLRATDKFYNVQDPCLRFAYHVDQILQQRALINYAMDNNLPYSSIHNLNFNFTTALYKGLSRFYPSGPIRDFVLNRYVMTGLENTGLRVEDIVKMSVVDIDTISPYRQEIIAKYNQTKKLFSKGSPAYNFSLPDTSGRIVTLNDFKGKVVVLDFMYTGCPGCIQIVPTLTRLEKSYQGNLNVVFISISISNNISGPYGWKAGIGKFNVKSSIQLNASFGKDSKNNYDHPSILGYAVNAYPTLVVIDKEGKLVTNRAPRPDTDGGKALSTLIDETLMSK